MGDFESARVELVCGEKKLLVSDAVVVLIGRRVWTEQAIDIDTGLGNDPRVYDVPTEDSRCFNNLADDICFLFC